jgi:hypothetical protein
MIPVLHLIVPGMPGLRVVVPGRAKMIKVDLEVYRFIHP